MVYAVIALVGVAIGWLFASYQHAQQKAEQLAEREEMVAELSAAKQQNYPKRALACRVRVTQ